MHNYPEFEILYEEQANRRYQRRLQAHPDCRDPEHPGCTLCTESEEDTE